MVSKLSPSTFAKRDAFAMLYTAQSGVRSSSSKADGPVDENQNPFLSTNNFSATEPPESKVGRISADHLTIEWNKEAEFESMLTATEASTFQWVRNKNVGSNSKRAGGVKVVIKGCNSCQGCPARVCFLLHFPPSVQYLIRCYSLFVSGFVSASTKSRLMAR